MSAHTKPIPGCATCSNDTLQLWNEEWHCLDCDGPLCAKCHREPVQDEKELCGECISEEAQYYADMRDAEPPALSDTMTMQFERKDHDA